jgi:hypothetical protein
MRLQQFIAPAKSGLKHIPHHDNDLYLPFASLYVSLPWPSGGPRAALLPLV